MSTAADPVASASTAGGTGAGALARPLVRRGVLAVLCGQFVALALLQAWSDALTFDESPHLAQGLSALVHRDLRVNPEHPVLPAVLAAVPALAAGPDVPRTEAWEANRYFDYADEVVAAQVEDDRLRVVVFLSRLVPIAVALGCGLLLYVLATRWTDWRGGLLVAGLWLTTPIVVGYGHIDGVDLPFTLAVLCTVLAIDSHGRCATLRRAAILGLALGAALLTRQTGLVLLPVAALVVGARTRHDRRLLLRSVGAVLLVPLALVWTTYRAIDPTGPEGSVRAGFEGRLAAAADAEPVLGTAVRALPLPIEYRGGLAKLIADDDPRPAYLLGRSWQGSQPWYFPVVALVKLPIWVFVAVAAGVLLWSHDRHPELRRTLTAAAAPAGAVGLVLLTQPLNLGLRYAFPVIAVSLLLAAPLATSPRRAAHLVLVIVAVGQLASTVAAHPHSIAWVGLPLGSRHQLVADGDLDIGQWHREVSGWAEGKEVRSSLLAARGLPAIGRPLDDGPVGDAWVAVSASSLTVYARDSLAWLRAYCPVGTLAGGTVLLYRFATEPDRSAGPVRPVGPCADPARSIRRG